MLDKKSASNLERSEERKGRSVLANSIAIAPVIYRTMLKSAYKYRSCSTRPVGFRIG